MKARSPLNRNPLCIVLVKKELLLPEGAIRSFDKVAAYFDKKAFANLKSDASLEKKAIDWVASLELNDDKKQVLQ